jgi:hypothetical protein
MNALLLPADKGLNRSAYGSMVATHSSPRGIISAANVRRLAKKE